MQMLAAGVSYVDLNFRDRPRVIATAILQGAGGVTLVDPGPSSTLPRLRELLQRAGIGVADITQLVLTHIHLDHAGSAGTLVAEQPALRVIVHEKGAPHLVDPARLVASASRLYGDAMERLWGEVRPVPAAAITTVAGSVEPGRAAEEVLAGGRRWRVAHTPGHASHHVSYFDGDSGIALVGDTAGVRLVPHGYVLPPTPPPDIDLEAWRRSLRLIAGWQPQTLLLTHFGEVTEPPAHLAELEDHLELTAKLARQSLDLDGEDEARWTWFGEQVGRELARRSGGDPTAYETAARFDLNWQGLARYWRKRAAAAAAG